MTRPRPSERPGPSDRSVADDVPEEVQLGDVVVMLLAGTLAGLRDRLAHDGFDDAAELVAFMVDAADDHLSRTATPAPDS